MSLGLILTVLCAHFVADFICQSDYLARNKSSDNTVLTVHILVYMYVTAMFYVALLPVQLSTLLAFIFANGGLHWITDYITSRLTKRLWAEKRVHEFFVVIGFDQVLHYVGLFGTLYLLGIK